MQTARTVRLLGFSLYGCMIGLAMFSFWKPHAAHILLISSGITAMVCVILVFVGVVIFTPPDQKYWARGELWVLYGMFVVAFAIFILGVFGIPEAPAVVLATALLLALIFYSADKLGDDGYPTDRYY